jgi:SAM-dependent methyltransferase/uncharacterized protein YbaR (Trm112 family)
LSRHRRWEDFIRLLACPACGGDLTLEVLETNADRSPEGILTCGRDRHWYPVTGGVPRLLLPGPLRPDDEPFLQRWRGRVDVAALTVRNDGGTSSADLPQVQATFGYKWTRQIWWGIEGASASLMEEWLLPRYGWADRNAYDLFMKTRHRLLDAGCGLGREALRMARSNPEATVVGLELSHCVDEALKHASNGGLKNAFFVQGDLMKPPFKAAAFDFIMSEGVLHHTEDTHAALQALAALLRPSGQIGFYVYRKKAPLREYADDYVREMIQNCSSDEAWKMMEPLTKLGKALADLKTEVEVPEDVAVLGIRAGRYDIQRLIYYTMFKCYWNDRLTFEENVLVNFDWYTPRFARRHTVEEVRRWIEEAGLQIVHESVEESGITVRAELAAIGTRMP